MVGKKFIRVLTKMIMILFLIIVVSLVGALGMMRSVQKKGEKNIVSVDKLPKDVDAIIVLGAGVKEDGSPSDILVDRLKTSIEVYNSGVSGKLLLSGDHGRDGYNEVKAMKKFMKDNMEIDNKDIFLDHAGFSTYDSIYRAKEIFKVEKAIIVTNEYHLPRALYLAEKMGIEAYGLPSDIRNYLYIDSYRNREKVAQLKDFIYANVLKPDPEFLGEEIPVGSMDGRVTDDEV
ncbi:SanA/YdcF family protein [Clostridium paraputrificum]|uniref:SanA/YdcF family protein n=1 Tax=Clostridium TaxID=1485 RepID=UPI003D32FC52